MKPLRTKIQMHFNDQLTNRDVSYPQEELPAIFI